MICCFLGIQHDKRPKNNDIQVLCYNLHLNVFFSVIHFAKDAKIPTVSTSTGLANDITKEGVSPPAAIPPHIYS